MKTTATLFRSIFKLTLSITLLPGLLSGQEQKLQVINDIQTYEQAIRTNSDLKLLNINEFVDNLELDLRYATANNFTRTRLYPKNLKRTFLIFKAATALSLVASDLEKLGYGIKVFDAYRPYSVTQKFWELIQDERYVANPAKGSGHNRGTAIDLTLYNLKTKAELNMGTGFDNFSDTAHHNFKNLSVEILTNRKILKETMEKYGFNALETEWWHYSLVNASSYPLLNIQFKQLK